MTDVDSTKVIAKLTEVLELLKASKPAPAPATATAPAPAPAPAPAEPTCNGEEGKKCPLRKVMAPKDFDGIKDFKICDAGGAGGGDCGGDPLNIPEHLVCKFDSSENWEEKLEEAIRSAENRAFCNAMNTFSTIMLVLTLLFLLTGAIKRFYSGV